jgi:hypothetical protein
MIYHDVYDIRVKFLDMAIGYKKGYWESSFGA